MTFYKEKLLRLRKSLKLSQTEFAKKLNLSRSYIAQIEGGSIQPSSSFLEKVANEFDINKKFFFTDDNQTPNIDLIQSNVHLISSSNVHLSSNLDFKSLANYVDESWIKMERYYQRLIDIKLMINNQDNNEIEKGLSEFIERFAKIKDQYFNYVTYYKSNIKMNKDLPVIEFSELDKESIIEIYKKTKSDLDLFEHIFFEFFRKFFNEYMKDWYNTKK